MISWSHVLLSCRINIIKHLGTMQWQSPSLPMMAMPDPMMPNPRTTTFPVDFTAFMIASLTLTVTTFTLSICKAAETFPSQLKQVWVFRKLRIHNYVKYKFSLFTLGAVLIHRLSVFIQIIYLLGFNLHCLLARPDFLHPGNRILNNFFLKIRF